MNRFFTDRIQGNTAEIAGEDIRHIEKVLRLRAGDRIVVCDGAGTDYTAEISSICPDRVTCALSDARASDTESAVRVTLLQAVPKSGKMETIVQKCVELGVYAVQPVLTARCVPLPSRDYEKKRVRYQRVALEAAKQSRRGIIPAVGSLIPLDAVDVSRFDSLIVAYEQEKETTLKQVLKEGVGREIGILIGPEGGFEEDEISRLRERGSRTVSLGTRILRTETAGMAMLAQILYELES
ncbi:MAG: 16S rRNA (uracil(1498)-N(3))-methyltransferase [Clostridia bacterium]|nr:16S rRNA (uracil(1498)-N(3))-methyltransferase [Clostridia bacterium]